jgi:N-ethylmaleimide reductase
MQTNEGSPMAERAESVLFQPGSAAGAPLKNRIVMSAMTRGRTPGGVQGDLNVEYYVQRSGAGLIMGESSSISPSALGFSGNNPRIYTEEHAAGWKKVTDAVHAKGSRMFLQLWHCGRNSHPEMMPGGALPTGPSATPPSPEIKVRRGALPPVIPRELQVDEVGALLDEYRNAARRAMEAGFDAVEVHAGNGYLLDQFLRDCTNKRTDAYGGSPANRSRLLFEVVEAVCEVWGESRVGVRISPNNRAGYGMHDSNPRALYECVVKGLQTIGISFLDVVEGETTQGEIEPDPFDFDELRSHFSGTYISNNGHTFESATEAIRRGYADLVSFGRPFVANPDLPHRLLIGAPLNEMRVETYTGKGAEGYTDYPTWQETESAAG